MKRILFLLTLFAVVSATQAQSTFRQTTSNPTGAIINTASDTMFIQVNKDYTSVGIQPVITKATGTMAGTAVLYGSLDGVNYVAAGDTLTLTNSTVNSAVWSLTNPTYSYYRIIVGGATTVTGTASAILVGRRANTYY